MEQPEKTKLSSLIAELDIEGASKCAAELFSQGMSAEKIGAMVVDGLNEVGARYAREQYYLADLVVSGMIAKNIYAITQNGAQPETAGQGVIVIGTIEDDIHDIGKDVFVNALRAKGLYVIDLGVDVRLSEFVFAVRKYHADIVGVSCVMINSVSHLMELGKLLDGEGLLNECKYIIGGAVANGYLEVAQASLITNELAVGVDYCVAELQKKYGQGQY